MKAFSEQGVFWLLDSPSNRAPGVLNYDPVSGITLDLMGTSRQTLSRYLSRYLSDEVEPGYLILGILQTGKSVLLEDCSVSSIEVGSQGTGFSYFNTSYIVRAIYLDVHFDDDMGLSGELLFDKIIVEFPPLLQWVGVSGLSCEWDQPDASKIAAWFEKPAEIKASAETGDEAGFDFICALQSRKPTFEIKLTQTTRFFYTSQDACGWNDLLRQSTAIARLLSVVFDKKILPSRVTLRQAGEWEPERYIEIFFCPDEYAEEIESREEINRHYNANFNSLGQMSYAALGGMSFVTKWLELADKNYAVLSKLMSCKFGSMPYIEDKFHQARSAIEAYWVLSERGGQGKQFRPAKKLLVDLVKEAGLSDVAVLGEEPVSWASSVEAHRNGYSSHFYQVAKPVDMKKMEQQTDCLYYLTLILLLKDAGVEDSALYGIRDYVKRFQSIRIS